MDNLENTIDEETTYQSTDNETSDEINDESEYESDEESDEEEELNLENFDFLRFFNNDDFLIDEDTDEDTQKDEDTPHDDQLSTNKQPPMETRVRLHQFIEDVD